MNKLEEIIVDIIDKKGPITFAEFMEHALYYPEFGYYNTSKPKIGKEGDFYTSPDVHPLFGMMIAKKIEETLLQLKEKNPVQKTLNIIEFGAGKGLLALDILTYFKEENPSLLKAITYNIIDVSPSLIKIQQETLAALNLPSEALRWLKSLDDLTEDIYGCILSNELIDAFPVHRVKQFEEKLLEVYVSYDKEKKEWIEIYLPPSTPLLQDYLKSQNICLETEQEAEINLNALTWLEKAVAKLSQGLIITIDYGALAQELYADYRHKGTLVCFHKHRLVDNPYINIGEQDITAHVNFTALINKGTELGLSHKFSTQSKFLLNMGIMETIAKMSTDPLKAWQAGLAAKKLVLPGGMGETFKVLIQENH